MADPEAILSMAERTVPPRRRGRLANLVADGMRSKLLRNILTVVTGTAGAQAVTMALMPVITRLYGPEAYGALGVFMGLSMMLIPVAALTYPIAIVLPKRDENARGLVKLSLVIGVFVALLTFLILFFFHKPIVRLLSVEEISRYILLLPVVMYAGCALEVSQQWMIRTQRYGLTAKVAILHSMLHNGIRILGGLLHATPGVLVITTGLGPALQAVMLTAALRITKTPSGHREPDDAHEEPLASPAELARRHSDFPLFRAPQIFINAVSQHMPTLVLAAFFGPAVAGFFTLCRQALTMPTTLIGKSVADVYYPRVVQAIHNREPITAMLVKAIAGLAIVGLVPFATVVAVGPWLFGFVFGQQWHMAGELARWLALAEYAIFISRPCVVAVPALSLQGRFLIFEVVSTALRIGSLMIGAMFMEDALATVKAFTFASLLIYGSLVAIVLIESRRWHARLATA
jgi:O-antigen/teichoic acid export membrane protein